MINTTVHAANPTGILYAGTGGFMILPAQLLTGNTPHTLAALVNPAEIASQLQANTRQRVALEVTMAASHEVPPEFLTAYVATRYHMPTADARALVRAHGTADASALEAMALELISDIELYRTALRTVDPRQRAVTEQDELGIAALYDAEVQRIKRQPISASLVRYRGLVLEKFSRFVELSNRYGISMAEVQLAAYNALAAKQLHRLNTVRNNPRAQPHPAHRDS